MKRISCFSPGKKYCDPNSEATQPTTPKRKSQSTLLAFKEPTEATVPSSNDASFKDVICAIEKLYLKVDQFESQHSTLQQLVFEDDNVRANIVAMKEAKNIYELTDISEFLEFFFTMKIQKLLYFDVYLVLSITSWPNQLSVVSPHLKPSRSRICSSSNGNLCTGLCWQYRSWL